MTEDEKQILEHLKAIVYYIDEQGEVLKDCKHRAEVAERALSSLCDTVMRNILVIVFSSTKTQVKNKQELYDYCMEQAEREIEEDRKDD